MTDKLPSDLRDTFSAFHVDGVPQMLRPYTDGERRDFDRLVRRGWLIRDGDDYMASAQIRSKHRAR